MNHTVIFTAGHTAALKYAVDSLKQSNCIFAEKPGKHITHLLLPVPSFESDGTIKGGGKLSQILEQLPQGITVIGGNLNHPDLKTYKTIDLLTDQAYIAHNANITAYCAVQLAMNTLPITLHGCPVLVIGWGRIGKCLSHLLKQLGANVTVATRSVETKALLPAFGYNTKDITEVDTEAYRLIYNTAPAMIYPQCNGDAIKIDLASKPGLGGLDVIWARGLPGKIAPESSGNLIANTVIENLSRKE